MSTDRWLAVVGLAVAVLGVPFTVIVSRYYYRRSNKKRVPTFVIESRTALCQPSLTKSARNLTVLCDGKEVVGKNGITQAKLYFWNSGTLAMRADDVLQQYTISLPVPILSYALTKVSREVTHLSVQKNTDKQLILSFSALEEGDGCTLTIVYDGPPSTAIEFNGASLDAPKPMVLPPDRFYSLPKSKRFIEAYGPILGIPLMAVIGALISAGILFGSSAGALYLLKRFLGDTAGQKAFSVLAAVIIACFLLFTIGVNVWPRIRRINAPYLPPDVKE